MLGDKARARRARRRAAACRCCRAPTGRATLERGARVPGVAGRRRGAIMIKAVAGGGGRGMRVGARRRRPRGGVCALPHRRPRRPSATATSTSRSSCRAPATSRCRSSATAPARSATLASASAASSAATRSWSRSRPAPSLAPALRAALLAAAVVAWREAVRYASLGTFEFLVDCRAAARTSRFAFIEANPRLQVEHTVTEEVTGVDLVAAQLALAAGASLAELGLHAGRRAGAARHAPCRRASTWRRWRADGTARPAGGTLSAFEPPSGPGVRVDTFGYAGYRTSPQLRLAARQGDRARPSADLADAAAKTLRALCEFRIEGVATNIAASCRALLQQPGVRGRRHPHRASSTSSSRRS